MLAAWLLIAPLTLDTFAVSAALGVARGRRLVTTLVFTLFEGGMPLVGALGGGLLGREAGSWAAWIAILLLAGAGVLMLFEREDRLPTGLIALGLSVSLDELAIGISLGLLQVPLLPVCLAIAAQAAIATQLGLRLGARVGERFREGAERVAGGALIALALIFAAIHLV